MNIDDFTKWKQNKAIVVDSDMDPSIQSEAKDFVISGIEKAYTGPQGFSVELACKYVKD